MNQQLKAIEKTKSNIRQLCQLVNSYDKSAGGNGLKVREDDFLESIETLDNLLRDRKTE